MLLFSPFGVLTLRSEVSFTGHSDNVHTDNEIWSVDLEEVTSPSRTGFHETEGL